MKDSVFSHLFSEPKYLLELYKTLHPEDTSATESDIKDITIENIITDNMYNDLGFFVRDRLFILLEAQSTWSENIVIRILLYLTQTYNRYFTKLNADLYSSAKIKLPKPELYVIYTGSRKEKPEELSLSELFFGSEKSQLEVRVKMLYGGAKDIISQYVAFTKVCDDQIRHYGYTQKAAKETLRICKDKNILKQYLKEREVELMDIMKTLFDEDEIMRRYYLRVKNEIAEEAMAQGMAQGTQQANFQAAKRLFARGSSEADVADILNLNISAVRQMRAQFSEK